MDWWLILLIFIVIVLIVWWLLSRQVEDQPEAGHHEEAHAAVSSDDLTKIEGIGPKVKGLLNEAGIMTFAQLAAKTPEELDAILDAAGSIYKAMDETSWPKQAKLAAAGKWEDLKKLQDELVGGK
jgi:predicted flap endonuclease-1-like 5' DNA nuclease